MAEFLISTLRQSLEDRIAIGADVSDIANFVSDALKKNIKQNYFSEIILVIGAYKRSEQQYYNQLITAEAFNIAGAVFSRNLVKSLDRFEDLDKMGLLRSTDQLVMPASNAILVDQEKVIGKRSFLPTEWFKTGDDISREICKIRLDDDTTGTGLYLKGGYVLTNRHVLPNKEIAAKCELIFNFNYKDRTETILRKLDVDADFLIGTEDQSDLMKDFDFALFKLKGTLDFPGIELSDDLNMPKNDDMVCVIQHPWGRPKELSLGPVMGVDDQTIHYAADTNPGSSGAPVFNKKWQLVALHFGHLNNENFNRGLRIDQLIKVLSPDWKDRLLSK